MAYDEDLARNRAGGRGEGVTDERDLAAWAARGVDFARSQPAKG